MPDIVIPEGYKSITVAEDEKLVIVVREHITESVIRNIQARFTQVFGKDKVIVIAADSDTVQINKVRILA